MTTTAQPVTRVSAGIDPRGPQFTAGVTAVVLAVVLLLPSPVRPAADRGPGRAVRDRRRPAASSARRTRGCSARSCGRGSAPPTSSRTRHRRGSPRRVGLVFARSALVGFAAGVTLLGQVAIGLALVAALLNAVFGFCLGCEMYLLIKRLRLNRRPEQPHDTQQREGTAMTRESSLVSAQWVEDHLDDPKVVLVEVDEDTTAYDKGHIKGAIKLDWTTDLQDQVRRDFVNKAAVRGAALGAAASPTTTPSCSTAATTTGSPPTPTGTSSSTATRTSSCSTAAARSGSSTPAS